MLLEFLAFGTLLAFLLALLGFSKKVPFANVLSGILFLTLALLSATQGIDVKSATHKTITTVDANTTVEDLNYEYTSYGYSSPFTFSIFWIYLGLSLALFLYTFVY